MRRFSASASVSCTASGVGIDAAPPAAPANAVVEALSAGTEASPPPPQADNSAASAAPEAVMRRAPIVDFVGVAIMGGEPSGQAQRPG